MDKKLQEAITAEADLLLKIQALPEADIFKFMQDLRGGTYFNMGMYKVIKPAKAYKGSLRIYCVQNYAAIVSGVSYENIGTTKEFRDATGEAPEKSWYDHAPGFENKVGLKKSDPNAKYVLWDIKAGTTTWVRYYIVDIATGDVTAVSKKALLASAYLTQTEKNKLTPSVPTGFDKDTGTLVENKTVWRTAAFEHIFWLSQGGQNPMEFGAKFVEALGLQEGTADTELFRDANAFAKADVDAILSGEILGEGCHEKKSVEELPPEPTKQEETEPLTESPTSEIFVDKHAGAKAKPDDILSGKVVESKKLKEAATKKYFYVICKMYDDIVAHGIQEVDLSKLSAYDTAEDFAMTEFFDGTDIAYSGEYDDEYGEFDWDNLTRYVGEIPASDINKYSNLSDKEAQRLIDDSSLDFIEEGCTVNKKLGKSDLKESYRRTVSRGASLIDNELFVDFD